MGVCVMINKDSKYKDCCYRHHSLYNECKMHAQTIAYTVSISQLLARILRYGCGWLAATVCTTARCEFATLT